MVVVDNINSCAAPELSFDLGGGGVESGEEEEEEPLVLVLV